MRAADELDRMTMALLAAHREPDPVVGGPGSGGPGSRRT
jgi:hypothetical protein